VASEAPTQTPTSSPTSTPSRSTTPTSTPTRSPTISPTIPLGGGGQPIVIEGCIYNESNGALLTGFVSAGGTAAANVIDNGGSDGCYLIQVVGDGTVVVQLTPPAGFYNSQLCTPAAADFDPSGLPAPCQNVGGDCALGADPSGTALVNFSCAANPFFRKFAIVLTQAPDVLNNNIPLRRLDRIPAAPLMSPGGYVMLIAALLLLAMRFLKEQAVTSGARHGSGRRI
jgi:hypothetical protein